MPRFQIQIHPWEQKEVASSKVRRVGGGWQWETTTILFCGQKGGVLLMLQRFNENRWQPFTAFPLKALGDVSSSGNGTGIAASSHGGSASKGTTISNLYKHIKSIFFNNSGNFWVCHCKCICNTQTADSKQQTSIYPGIEEISTKLLYP